MALIKVLWDLLVIGQKLLGVLGQAIATVAKTWVVVVADRYGGLGIRRL